MFSLVQLLLWVLSSLMMACSVSLPLQVVVLLVGALLGELLIPLFMSGQKWLFMGRMKPGSHRFFSAEHTRWLVCSGVQMTLGNSLVSAGPWCLRWRHGWRALGMHAARYSHVASLCRDRAVCSCTLPAMMR